MRKDQWAATLRRVAEKANPTVAHALRQIATRNDTEADQEGEWIAGPERDPGEEG